MSETMPRWKRHQWTLSRTATLLGALSKKGKALKVSEIQQRYGVGIRELLALTRKLGVQEDTGTCAWNYLDLRLDYDDQDRLIVGSIGAAALEALTRLSREDLQVAAEALDGLALSPSKGAKVKKLSQGLRSQAGTPASTRAVIYRPAESKQEQKKLSLLSEGEEKRVAVSFDYYGASAKSRRRKVNPLVLKRDAGLWRLLAFDHNRQKRRIFRVDYMRALKVSQERFEWPGDLSRSAARARNLGQFTPKGGEIKVKMKVGPEVYQEFKAAFDKKIKIRKFKNGWVAVSLLASSSQWVLQAFRPYAGQVQILAPAELAKNWQADLAAIRKIYKV